MSLIKFYSLDATDPLDPSTASEVFELSSDPESVDTFSGSADRGSVFKVLDPEVGVITQDHGRSTGGRIISFSDDFRLKEAALIALKELYARENTVFYFTTGPETFKCQFSRNPRGLIYAPSLLLYAKTGEKRYSYTITLIVLEEIS